MCVCLVTAGSRDASALARSACRRLDARVRQPLTRPQRTVACGRQSECRFEDAGEVCLIGESRIARDLDEWTVPVNPVPCELETSHQQIAVWAGPEQDPELTAQVIACQPRDRLQLRRMHHTGPLGVQKLSSSFDGRNVDASREER